MVSYTDLLLVPDSWDWKRDVAGFYETHHNVFLVSAVLFYPVIFGIQYLMKNKEAFDLGGAKSKAPLNYIFWWEIGLALFSIVGCYHVLPMALEPILFQGKSLTETICMDGVHGDSRNIWTLFFMVSKVFEFGDTIFVVLRKKPLILLQHYHHLATMLYCWYGSRFVYDKNNTNVFFAGMNLAVHSFMYTWYARHTNWLAVPKAADDLHHPDSACPNGIWGLDRINQRVEQHGFLWEMAKGGRKGVLRCPVHVLFVLDPLCQIVLF